MIKNAVCLYEDQEIGIESICIFQNGKYIHIPGKIEKLRKLSRQKKLFCPCGCGRNFILVAGDKGLKRPHFRAENTPGARECTYVEESTISLHSKMMLRQWMEYKLNSNQVEGRVPINKIFDTERKFEYTLYDYKNKIGLCYWYNRANIESEKVDTIENCSEIKNAIHIVDFYNADSLGQYPEYMIKIQNRQRYLLYLDMGENDNYEDVYLIVKIYVEKQNKEWKELLVVSDKLDSFNISSNGELIYQDKLVSELAQNVAEQYKADEIKRIETRIAWEEERRREREIIEAQAEIERQKRQKDLEAQKAKDEQAKAQREAEAKAYAEELEGYDFEQNEIPIYDINGNRLLKCTYCGKIAIKKNNFCYHDKKAINKGACKGCSDLRKKDVEIIKSKHKVPTIIEEGNCPNCNGIIVERNTSYGRYRMCIDYPVCGFREKVN